MQFPDCVNGPTALTTNLVCDPSASPADRAAAIVAAMSTSEKLVNMVDRSLGVSRLGLPEYEWWSEALHGVAYSPGVDFASSGEYSYATSFANPILMSAAFDDDLIEAVATVVSTEARAFSNGGRAGLDFWTPNINPYKDPRWGRGMETPGEDPFRIKGYVKSLLFGLEGGLDPPTKKIIATCKHFAAYDLERWEGVVRYGFDAIVSTQDLAEYYLPPFQQCARDSHVGSIMCSYNAVNGVPACANSYLMETILRGHWGWTNNNQYITSDCNAIQNIYSAHAYSKSLAEATGVAYTAGTDTICEAGQAANVMGAYNQSFLADAVLDKALTRQYEALVRVGYFNSNETIYRNISWTDVNTVSSQRLALQSATDGIVMLKNDGTLPLKLKNSTTLAMIGMWANATTQMLGNYNGIPAYIHGPVYAAQQLGVKVNFAPGPTAQGTTNGTWTGAAIQAAKNSDIVLYFGGIDNSVEAEDKDRTSIAWSSSQLSLIQQICSLGKPCIVVQLGDQLDDSPLLQNKNISAILWAGYPGQDGGTAVFKILTGQNAPAGRLPVTQYPAAYVNEVPMTDMSLRPSSSNPGRTYKFYNASVLPFGFGLHYTKFTTSFLATPLSSPNSTGLTYPISRLLCSEDHLDLCPFPSIPITVTNTGNKTTSDFVALAFITGTYGPQPYPLKQLAAYTRVRNVSPGESRIVGLTMTLGNLARVDASGNTILYPGRYTVLLDVPTQAEMHFTLVGEETILDKWPQPPNNATAANGTLSRRTMLRKEVKLT
ncbi:glycoside hydrolase family 3 protein [Glonium stellatum]|uniref:xylan 1,4-beta-xylosidase n=1 Tax=Glonium stellatum TaxID=574774 RepID=A0A8E2ETY3_9PEZI|nr:glycoside hydrolase family 3 protein [Glonium stellatum]